MLFGTVDTWLIWNLTNGKSHITDPSNASRTLLYNIKDDKWDKDLLDLFDVPEKITSSIPDPLILFAEVSPMHHLNDSTILDFQHPFGPTIPVKPSSIIKVVFSANDLKPFN